MTRPRRHHVSEAELTRLADGSLPPARAAEVEAIVAASPELSAALAEQRAAVALLRGVDDPAPSALRATVGELTPRARHAPAGRAARPRWPARARHTPVRHAPVRRALAAGAALTAAAAAVLAITLTGGGVAAPTAAQAARLALASPTRSAPAVDPSDSGRLRLSVGEVSFPNWPGWRATGARTDRIGGRTVQTVFYEDRARDVVGYSIVAGAPVAAAQGPAITAYGTRYTMARHDDAHVVTWVEGGHTCVVAATAVDDPTLVALAQTQA